MRSNPQIALVYGDIGNKLFDKVKDEFPRRAVNAGVAEANMITVASGMANSGLIPITYTISSFHYLKTLEQVKLDSAYGGNKIIMVGTGGGLSYAGLGTTHHSLEDLAVLGSVPELNIFLPADLVELDLVLERAIGLGTTSWIRIGKKEAHRIHSDGLGDSSDLNSPIPPRLLSTRSAQTPVDVAILATGLCVEACLEAANMLSEQGLTCDVWSFPQVVPFPLISEEFGIWGAQKIVVVEEHVEHGGLLTRVLHSAAKFGGAQNISGINTGTRFLKGLSEAESARLGLGLSTEAIAERCLG